MSQFRFSSFAKSYLRLLQIPCGIVAIFLLSAIPAWATTWTVTSNADSGAGTLREAMNSAQSGDTITFGFSTPTTITLASTLPTIAVNMTITGPTSGSGSSLTNLVTLDGGGSVEIVKIYSSSNHIIVSVANLNFANGFSILDGGAINNESYSTLTVSNSTFTSNTSRVLGGAINNEPYSTLTVSNSTFTSNTSSVLGGAINNESDSTLTVSNSTFASNTAGTGGGIVNQGEATVVNSTFVGNSAPGGYGSGIYDVGTSLQLYNNIFTGNQNTGFFENSGHAPSESHNIFNDGTYGFTMSSTDLSSNPNLSAQGSYGGLTQTMIPQPGSSAICAGSYDMTLKANNSALSADLTTDQRGAGYNRSNTTYSGYSADTPCVDAGAVQTNYALQGFTIQPSAVDKTAVMTPAPVVTLNESGTEASFASSGTVTVTDAYGYLSSSATPTAMLSSGVATFNNLIFTTTASDVQLTATLPLNEAGTISLTASSSSFNVDSVSQAQLSVTGMPTTAQVYGTSFTVGTSGGTGSGAVTYYGSGACSASGTTVTMTSGTDTCSVYAYKAGAGIYSEATSATVKVSATTATQSTLAVTGVPTTAQAFGATFTVGSTGGSGTGTVTFAGSGACSASGTTVTMTSGTGTCSVTASKATDGNYSLATSAASTVSASLATQSTLAVTGIPTTAQAYGATFTVGSSGGSGSGAVTFAGSGACSASGTTVTMTSGTGTCSVTATKATDGNYASATSAPSTVNASLATQSTLAVTGVPTTTQAFGATFTVGSTGGSGSGTVTFAGSGACSASGTTITMTNGTGTCSVTASKATDGNYASATSAAFHGERIAWLRNPRWQ